MENWKGLKTIGVAIRVSQQGEQETSDVRYYINSTKMGVKRFAQRVRGHWAIENTLHWCLDVTFREDDSRLRDRHAADNLAWLKRFAISLLKQQTDKESIAMRRRMAGWNPAYLAKVVGLSKSYYAFTVSRPRFLELYSSTFSIHHKQVAPTKKDGCLCSRCQLIAE